MKFTRTLASIAIAATMAFGVAQDFGPFSTGGGPSKAAWEEFKLPSKTIKLDFRNSNPDSVLSAFTKTSGITIIKDPTLTQPLTLTTAKAVPLKQAFEILNAALSVRNFELKKEGSLMVIRAKPRQNQGRGGGMSAMDPNMLRQFMNPQQGGENDLQVYPIKFAAASSVARVINEVFANQQANRGGLAGMFQMGGGGGGGRGGNPFANLFNQGGQQGLMVRASADDFSNSVIVNAPREQQADVEKFIKQIDKETDQPLKPAVYKLEFASATDMQTTVQNLLIANQPKGRGSSSTNQNIDRQFSFFGGGGGQNNQQQRALVSADTRTNSLIVTTTEDNQKLVAQVVKDLDTEVKVQTSTFVFPLDNARADDIAGLLQSTFGTRNGSRGGTAGTTNRNRGTTNQQNRNNANQNRGNTTGRAGLNSEYIPVNLADPDVEAGELETLVAAQGGFFNFGGGGQGQNQNQNRQNAQTQGRDANGRLIPVQDPTNQVTVIPDPNTNSIIVVTSPEYADVIRQILGQLDKIPEQVMIETIIVEATLDASDKLGVDWQFTQEKLLGNTGVTGVAQSALGAQTNIAQGFRYTLSGGNLSAFIGALKSDTKFQVLSTPRIFTSNNVQAEINISQRVPFVTSQRADVNGNITYTYDFEDVGIVLTVTPRITSNGYVTMDVSQTANDLQGFTSFNAPIVNQRQADTTVAVKDGDTIILGGIIRNTVTSKVNKIPILGDIPILGNLFKSTDKSSQKTELMVFLTPRVVRNPDEAVKLREDEQKKLSKQSEDQLKSVIGGSEIKQTPVKKNGGGK